MRKLVALIGAAIFLSLLSITPSFAHAAPQKQAAEEVPSLIADGMKAYKDKGPEEAVKVWIKASPLDGSKDALSQSNNLRQVQDYYGAYLGYEVVESRDLAAKTKIVYVVLDYDKGPLFGRFVLYHSDQGWILTNFLFNTSVEKVFPDSLH